MRFRELKLRPLAGDLAADGEARVFRVKGDVCAFAVLRGEVYPSTAERVGGALRAAGFKGVLLCVPPGQEVTLCEVDDGSPARWQEDGRPSYADLERRVKELESMAAMGSGADCAPCTVKP